MSLPPDSVKLDDPRVDDVLNLAYDRDDRGGSTYPGMTYENGVRDTIEWLRGNNEPPLVEAADDIDYDPAEDDE